MPAPVPVVSLGVVPLAAIAVTLILALLAPSADAANFQRPFKEAFGRTAQPTFAWAESLGIDRATGDLLVADFETQEISRFNPDGTPAPFSSLGTNVIDGKEFAGKPCTEEPVSCDKTPQNGIELNGAATTEIAVDESGGPTDGDIYVTQPTSKLVDIFASNGRYLGQLTAAGLNFRQGPCGVTVDAAGAVYVGETPPGHGEIHKFVPTGNPVVNADNVANFSLPQGQNICSLAAGSGPTAGSIFGVSTGGNGGLHAYQFDKETGELKYTFAEGFGNSSIAVDPITGRVMIPSGSEKENEAGEFEAPGGSAPVQVARVLLNAGGIVFGSSGNAYIDQGPSSPNVSVYGAPAVVPTVTADPASNVTGTKATLSGTVNPEGLEVAECLFEYGETTEYGNTAPCEGSIPTDSSPHSVHLHISELEPNGHTYHYRLLAKNANGTEESADQTLATAATAATEAATKIGTTTATLHGTVRPEGLEISECVFEYGLATSVIFENSIACNPDASAIEPDSSPHPVSATIAGLQVGASYRFRLVATNSTGVSSGEELTFTTLGPPQITEIRALNADQTSVTLEAKIDPRGFGTSYHFEWGATSSYGNSAPANSEPYIGVDSQPAVVAARVSDLTAGTTYHYRLVAKSAAGTEMSTDQEVETLDTCGLPDQRCFELVSPPDVGPVATPGKFPGELELHRQVAAGGPGAFAYGVETGLPDATVGTEVLFLGERGPGGWSSSQITPPIIAPNESKGERSVAGRTDGLSEDLSCGVVTSFQPLTADASAGLIIEEGGANLYRRNMDGSYALITTLPPQNPAVATGRVDGEYQLIGMSPSCGRIVFSSSYEYPGIPGAGPSRLYEWDDGTLRGVGSVPGPTGETSAEVVAGSGAGYFNAVSADASRVFFTAERLVSSDPLEVGKAGVFVREDGARTADVSLSQGAEPDSGATYQSASRNGSHVFFTANAGLTAETSVGGTDLYEYDLGDSNHVGREGLVDLSVDHDTGGADVASVLGASEDGSHVYFTARGQLVPGRGGTFAQNQSAGTYSVYGEEEGNVRFVGSVRAADLKGAALNGPSRLDGTGFTGRQVTFV